MRDHDYIVFRGTGIPGVDGSWHERSGRQPGRVCFPGVTYPAEVFPTGMIDVRDDGAVAEIWAPRDWKVPPE